jgi:sulfur carrier protein
MNLVINGEKRKVTAKTVSQLVKELALNPGLIVIELDKEIVGRDEWEHKQLQEEMTIEIVHFVGGG